MQFSQELTKRAFNARLALAGKDARTFARDLLQMSQRECSAAFKISPMKRAKLRGLQRNAVLVLGTIGADADVPMLDAMLKHEEPLMREHAAWALAEHSAA